MRKLYFAFLFPVSALFAIPVFAQKKASSLVTVIHGERPVISTSTHRGASSGCDTLKFAASESWTPTLYVSGSDGYITGKNKYNDIQKASLFDASATDASFLIKVWIYFGAAGGADLTKQIPVNVYDYNAATGQPGNLLGTSIISFQDIKTDVDNKTYTQVQFDPAVRLPDSKKFFVSVQFSSLVWTTPAPPQGNDTLAIYSNAAGESANDAREQSFSGGWATIGEGWGSEFSPLDLFIFPFVSANTDCGVLPLKLLSFTAERKSQDVFLKWNVANEYNMLGYELERAEGDLTFKKVAFIDAANASSYSYSFTDKNVSRDFSGKVTYRLKQINKDGSYTYSSYIVVDLGANSLSITFENPIHNSLQLHITSPLSQKINVRMYDMQGRLTGVQKETVLNAGSQIIDLTGASSLAAGTYIVDVLVNNKHWHYKVIKN